MDRLFQLHNQSVKWLAFESGINLNTLLLCVIGSIVFALVVFIIFLLYSIRKNNIEHAKAVQEWNMKSTNIFHTLKTDSDGEKNTNNAGSTADR